jgi:hypothetical protein
VAYGATRDVRRDAVTALARSIEGPFLTTTEAEFEPTRELLADGR